MPWNLLTTPSLTPRTGPLVVSMTRVGESAIAPVTATPRTIRIDAKSPAPARRRQRIVLPPRARDLRHRLPQRIGQEHATPARGPHLEADDRIALDARPHLPTHLI